MSSFKTKTIALIASSLIVAVAGLSFATTPAFAGIASKKSTPAKAARVPTAKPAATNKSTPAKPAATKITPKIQPFIPPVGVRHP